MLRTFAVWNKTTGYECKTAHPKEPRHQYADVMDKDYKKMFNGEDHIMASLDSLKNYDLSELLNVCESYLLQQKEILRLCQQMMDVSDDDLAAFARVRQELKDNSDHRRRTEDNIKIMQERKHRFLEAVEANGSQKK